MRKIAKLKWIPARYHFEDGERHLVRGTNEYSKTEFDYVGYFHQWAILDNKLYAVIEAEDGNIFRCESASVKFIDKC
jgi:hypothetical protein